MECLGISEISILMWLVCFAILCDSSDSYIRYYISYVLCSIYGSLRSLAIRIGACLVLLILYITGYADESSIALIITNERKYVRSGTYKAIVKARLFGGVSIGSVDFPGFDGITETIYHIDEELPEHVIPDIRFDSDGSCIFYYMDDNNK